MQYENRPEPEGINTSPNNPYLEFVWLLVTVGVAVVALVAILSLSAGWLAQQLPFAKEKQLATSLGITQLIDKGDPAIQQWLQQLANGLAPAEQLPAGMTITVHYVQSPEINAYATLGGNIVIFSGLLEKLHTENAVALVLAHEMAHIRQRDPLMALGRGTVIAVVLSLFAGGDAGMAQTFVGNLGLLTALSFTRQQERAADQIAVATLLAHYGTLNGAMELFEQLPQSSHLPELLRSHPLTEKRLAYLRDMAATHASGKPIPFSLAAIRSTATPLSP